MRHFDDMDLVSMRSGWGEDAAVLVFHAGPGPDTATWRPPARRDARLRTRARPSGHQLLLDLRAGPVAGGGPRYSRLKDTRDHSTVIVNGKGQVGEGGPWLDYWAFQQRQPAPSIRRAESTRAHDSVLGDAGRIYADEARLRHFAGRSSS